MARGLRVWPSASSFTSTEENAAWAPVISVTYNADLVNVNTSMPPARADLGTGNWIADRNVYDSNYPGWQTETAKYTVYENMVVLATPVCGHFSRIMFHTTNHDIYYVPG